MGEANRRRSRIEAEGEIKGDMAEICAETAAYLLNDSVDRTLLVGPVSWRPSDGTSPRLWYFIVVGCDRTGETFVAQLAAETEADAVEMRAGVMAALVEQRPVVIVDFDDELHMARWAEAVWPSAKITRIREGIEAERSARHAKPRSRHKRPSSLGPSHTGFL